MANPGPVAGRAGAGLPTAACGFVHRLRQTRVDLPVILKSSTPNAIQLKKHVEIPASTWAFTGDPRSTQRQISDYFWQRNLKPSDTLCKPTL